MLPTTQAAERLPQALRLLCLCLILLSVLRVGWSALHWDSTYDEYWHLLWSERALLDANFEREYSNFISTTPVTMLNSGARELARLDDTLDAQAQLAAARLPTVAAFIALLGLVYGLGRHLAGRDAGLLAGTLTALDANLATHGALATVDIYFAIATLAFLFQSLRFLESPDFRQAMWLAAIVGLGFVVKLSTVLFLPLLGVVLIIGIARRGAEKFLPTLFLWGLSGTALASLLINIVYQYQGVGFFLKDATLYSSFMLALQRELPWLFLLLPRSFIEGFDQTLSFERVMQWNTVIFDQYLSNGAWYYFPVTWFFKTPIAVLALLALAGWIALKHWPQRAALPQTQRRALWLMGLQWLLFLFYFNFVFRTHVGLRYILMCLPMAYLACAVVLQTQLARPWLRRALPLVLLVALVEHLPYAGNALSFSNAFIADKKNAWFVLTDSNIDWGQNYTQVFAEADAEHPNAVRNPAHILPGENLIRLNYLTGVFRNPQQHQWARQHLEPVRHLQHTHLLYNVDAAQFEQFIAEANTLEPVRSLQSCENGMVTSLPHEFIASSTGDQTLCLDLGALDLEIRVRQGWGVVGHLRDGYCQGYPMETGKLAIFRTPEAASRLCLSSNEVGTTWEISRRTAP